MGTNPVWAMMSAVIQAVSLSSAIPFIMLTQYENCQTSV
jgi:hypothetical protein